MDVIEQAGAIIVRMENSEPRVLLVTGRRNPDHWIFPKGHVEAGESLQAAALREAREEAGVDGTVLGAAGSHSFTTGDGNYHVHYYIVTTQDRGGKREGRQLAWCSYEDALTRLTFKETRRMLRRAWRMLRKAAR